jgi:hypothetical protein
MEMDRNDPQNPTQKTKDWATRTLLKTTGELPNDKYSYDCWNPYIGHDETSVHNLINYEITDIINHY